MPALSHPPAKTLPEARKRLHLPRSLQLRGHRCSHRATGRGIQGKDTFCSPQILPPTVQIPLTPNSGKWRIERQVLRPSETRGLLSLTPHTNVLREKCLVMSPCEYQVTYLSLLSPSFLPHRWVLSFLGSFNCFLS